MSTEQQKYIIPNLKVMPVSMLAQIEENGALPILVINPPSIRETLGRAAHQAMVRYFHRNSAVLTEADWTWESLDEDTKELYRCEADGVLEALRKEHDEYYM